MAKTAKIKSCLVSKANWREKTEDVTVKLFANMLERQKENSVTQKLSEEIKGTTQIWPMIPESILET